MPKIMLVTGGAGFIGSNYIRYLLNNRADLKIINFDKLTAAGNLSNLSSLANHPNYYFVRGDITDHRDVEDVFDRFNPDIVMHFAAEMYTDRYIANPDSFVHTNIVGTHNVILQILAHSPQKCIYFSTEEVYGASSGQHRYGEDSALSPINAYSASKASAEMLWHAVIEDDNLPVNIVRCTSAYGPFQFPDKLIAAIICGVLKEQEIRLVANAMTTRDFIHIFDVCSALDMVLERGEDGETYNIGTESEIEIAVLIRKLLTMLDEPEHTVSYIRKKTPLPQRFAIDTTRIRRSLGWKPRILLEDGLLQTIEWYRNHTEWIQELESGRYMEYYDLYYNQET